MSNSTVTHLLDDAGHRLCCTQDGPAVAASALLQDTCAEDVRYCPSCARAALAPSCGEVTRAASTRAANQTTTSYSKPSSP